MRIGVHGLGRIGLMHARNAAQTPGVDEVVLIGRDPSRLAVAEDAVRRATAPGAGADLAGDHAPAEPAASIRSTLDSVADVVPTLDGVVVATATSTHPELARLVAGAGTPLLIEKPLALTSGELRELATDLDATGTPIMVAFHRRYDPGYQRLREHVLDGDVGTLRAVTATDQDHHPLALDYIPASRGMWIDLLIHDFDIVPWVLEDQVVEVNAIGSVLDEPTYGEHGDVDTGLVTLRFASGAVGSVTGLRRADAGQDVRLEVVGTKGSFAAGWSSRTPMTSTEPSDARAPENVYDTFSNRFEPAFRAELAHFTRMIGGAAESLTPPSAGLVATGIAEAARESFHSGSPVRLH